MFFVEEIDFSQCQTGRYIEFLNEVTGNSDHGTVISENDDSITVERWDSEKTHDVSTVFTRNQISHIVWVK